MNLPRHRLILLALVGPFLCPVVQADPGASGPTPAEKQKTIAYLQSLQRPNGAFAADSKPETPPTLPATSAAARALKYFGGEVPHQRESQKFILSCYDRSSGGYVPTPGGKPDVRSTAVGVMVVLELNVPYGARHDLLIGEYLSKNAQSFEDIRISAAVYEALGGLRVPKEKWLSEIEKLRNSDGSFGKGENIARESGGAVAAILRFGAKLEQKEKALAAMRDGQRADGGFGKDGQTGADLESTYRVMRAFFMLKEKPKDVNACRAFIAKCRNADGSYSVQPGQPGNVSATYYAGIILHWLDKLSS